jgi:hypothetical protein
VLGLRPIGLPLFRAADAVEADTFSMVVVEDFDGVAASRIEMSVPETSAALIAERANNCNANGMRLHAWRKGRFLAYRPINGLRLGQ